jgi:uncharacterized protein YbaP (TraB family)
MNRKISIVVLVALLFIVSANAQLLWKVSGNGLTKPSYLFGTHHLIEKEQIKDFDKILDLAGKSDAVVGEMVVDNSLGTQLKIVKCAMMKDTTVRELINEADYSLVDTEYIKTMNMGLSKLGKMKPMMLSSMYSLMIYMKINNLKKQPEAVDLLFQNKAKKNKKSVIGLETLKQQMDMMFNSIPLKRQAEIMVKDVKEKVKNIELLKKMNEAYLSGNLTKIENINNEDDDMTIDEKKIMIYNRNTDWMKQIPTLFSKQSCFLAVGCMHLVGKTGLIDQLKKAGYTVEGIEKL